eukprot:maker-scaffold_22-snap-gene-0.1-mRNA-1 protein AED:0.00 eAED:0.00 QI:7/1/1/1/1/1/2/329/225
MVKKDENVGTKETIKEDRVELSIWHHTYNFCDQKLIIREDYEAGLGGTLFDGAFCLCNYFDFLYRNNKLSTTFPKQKVIELGAGCGVPGILLSKLGFSVALSDLEISIELLEENVETNFPTENIEMSTPKVIVFDWLNPPLKMEKYDVILAADTIYEPKVVPYFIEVLKSLSSKETVTVLAHPAPRNKQAIQKVKTEEFVPNINGNQSFSSATKGIFLLRLRQNL